MEDIALCLFAWDLQDEGIDPVLDFCADAGVTSLFLASVYHSGWFVHPHNPRRRTYMTEDGVAYFHPDPAQFAATPLQPKVAQVSRAIDWFAAVGEKLPEYGLKLTPWTVCLHNTRLGLAYPEHTVRNAFGDSYPHALCPSSPAAREYVRGIVRDLATRYPVTSVFLESPDYLGRRHGHHHERDGTIFPPLEGALMDLSFSAHDLAAADASGVDGRSLQEAVRTHLETFFARPPARSDGLPTTREQFLDARPDLADYEAVLRQQVTSLIAQVRDDIAGTGVLLEGCERADAYAVHLAFAYGKTPDEVAQITAAAKARKTPAQRLRIGFRLGFDAPESPRALTDAGRIRASVEAARDQGADSVWFYNYSESPRGYLDLLRPALAGL